MSKWDTHGLYAGPNWLVDKLGNVVGYRNKLGADFQIAAQTIPAGAESINPGALLSPGGAGSLFTSIANGLVPSSGGGTVNFLRADGTWATPPVSSALFSASTNGIVPLSGGGTSAFLRADGSWSIPPIGPSYSNFTSVAAGLTPASGGGTTSFLRADGTWATPPGSNYSVFNATTTGLTPASGGGIVSYLRADGSWTTPPGTTYANFTATTAGLVPLSGGGTSTFLRADGTWQTPAGSGDMALASVQTVTGAKTFADAKMILAGATSGTTTLKATAVAGTSTWTFPASNDTVAGLTTAQTFINKTLTTPSIVSIVNGAVTITMPGATTTLVGLDTTDTLTNKTFSTGTIAGAVTGVTQTLGDNTTKLATTAFVAALGATKAGTATFTSVANGLVPLSGGGTSAYLRADGTWVVPDFPLPPIGISYTTSVPLDNAVNGKDMGVHTLTASDNFTIAGSAITNGACIVSLQLASTYVPTFAAGISVHGDTITAEAGRVYEISFVQRPTGPLAFVTKTAFTADTTPPALGAPHLEEGTPTIIAIPVTEPNTPTLNGTTAGITLSGAGAGGRTVTNVAVSGGNLNITLSSALAWNDVINVAVAASMVKDASNNLSASMSATAVTNNRTQPAPNAPTGVTAGTVTASNIPISWTAPTADSTHGNPVSYQAQIRTNVGPGSWSNYGGVITHPTVAVNPGSLAASTAYDFQVKATNATGDSSFSSILSNITTASGATGSITYGVSLSPSGVDFTALGYDDWVMDGAASLATWHRKGNFGTGVTTGLIGLSSVNLTFPLWGHGSTGNTATDAFDTIGTVTSNAYGHDQAGAGDAKLQLTFPASSTTHHAYIWVQPDGTDSMTLRLTLSDASYTEQVITIPSQGSETSRLYTVTYSSAGGGTLTASLETGSGLSTHSYFLFNSAAYKSS